MLSTGNITLSHSCNWLPSSTYRAVLAERLSQSRTLSVPIIISRIRHAQRESHYLFASIWSTAILWMVIPWWKPERKPCTRFIQPEIYRTLICLLPYKTFRPRHRVLWTNSQLNLLKRNKSSCYRLYQNSGHNNRDCGSSLHTIYTTIYTQYKAITGNFTLVFWFVYSFA